MESMFQIKLSSHTMSNQISLSLKGDLVGLARGLHEKTHILHSACSEAPRRWVGMAARVCNMPALRSNSHMHRGTAIAHAAVSTDNQDMVSGMLETLKY